MSIEPEVPYNFKDDGSDDDPDESWRDPTISSVSDRPAKRSQRGPADDSWILPVREVTDILGQGASRIREIEKNTNTHIEFNHARQQIDIWGDPKDVAAAKAYLDLIASRFQEATAENTRKVLGWERPERELTGKEKVRFEKKQARLEGEKKYQKSPVVPQPFNAVYPLPENNDSLPMKRFIGENERYLNQIRVDCKAYIMFNQNARLLRVSGETEEAVKMATSRVRNWYLKCVRKPKAESILIMKQPKENCQIGFRRVPPQLFSNLKLFNKQAIPKNIYICCPVKTQQQQQQQQRQQHDDFDMMALEKSLNHNKNQLPANLQNMDRENQKNIEDLLEIGLESLRLMDGEIRMKIRFGQLCLYSVVIDDGKTYPIEKVSNGLFQRPQLNTILQPCIAIEKSQLDGLFNYLAQHGENFTAEPETSFSIYAKQRSTITRKSQIPPGKDKDEGHAAAADLFSTIITTRFTSDGHPSLWNCFMDETKDFTSIQCVDLETNYSWDWRLQYARRLLSEPDSPHGRFVSKLRLRDSNRLAMVIDDRSYRPTTIVQKTRWFYGWKEDFMVEICKDEIWNMSEITVKHKDLPVDLSTFDPHRVMFKVSLTMDKWRDRFAQNVNLSIGEAPRWTMGSFLARPNENVRSISAAVKEFSDILTETVPLYWSH